MSIEQLHALARSAAFDADLDQALVQALIEHESSWNPWAVRYEPLFYERYISHMNGLTATEMTLRACSFGLCQVMGQVAREQGFDGKFLTELLDPANSVRQGLIKLKKCIELAHGVLQDALLRYNGGSDSNYPASVLNLMDKYRISQEVRT